MYLAEGVGLFGSFGASPLRAPLRVSLRLSKFVPDKLVEPSGFVHPQRLRQIRKTPHEGALCVSGGGSGIRTHGGIATTPVFKTGALNRSAISPLQVVPPFRGAGDAGFTRDSCPSPFRAGGCAAVGSGLLPSRSRPRPAP